MISDEIFSLKKGVDRLKEIDDLLANVKVADLAVGSGAFPLGMLNEITKARNILTSYMSIGMNSFDKKNFILYGRRNYDLKINAIKNCIFACDIEPSAVDIAKLRLWLSIVIDDILTTEAQGDEYFNAHSKPNPLPNLDCNIICGNSLVDEFKGVKLISQSDLLNNTPNGHQFDMFQSGVDVLISKLIELQDKLFFCKYHEEKEEIKQQIQNIYNQIILEQIKSDPKLVDEYFETLEEPSKPFILWQLYFPKVFKENGGFYIVIGNPPYVQLQDLNRDNKLLNYYKSKYQVAQYKVDLYHLFIENGINLISNNGVISFIVPSNFTTNNYNLHLRKYMLENTYIKNIIYYDECVFSANVNNLVFVAIKTKENDKIFIRKAKIENNTHLYYDDVNILQNYFMKDEYIIVPFKNFEDIKIVNKMEFSTKILKDYANVNFGMQLRNRKIYINDVTNNEESLTKYHKPCYTGKDIFEYFTNYNGLYCYFKPDEAKCGGCWDQNVQFSNPKLLIRQIGFVPVVGIDEKGYAVLNTAFMISGFKENISPYFLLGLLNSKAIKFYWINKFSDNRKQFPKIKGGYLEKIPVARNIEIEYKIENFVKNILKEKDKSKIDEFVKNIDENVYLLYNFNVNEQNQIESSLIEKKL